jgi:hypothetical protein
MKNHLELVGQWVDSKLLTVFSVVVIISFCPGHLHFQSERMDVANVALDSRLYLNPRYGQRML